MLLLLPPPLPPLLLLLLLPLLLLLLPLPAVVPPPAASSRSSLSAISCTRAAPVPESSEGMPRSVRHVPHQSHPHFSLRADHHLFKVLANQPCVVDQTRVWTPNDGARLQTKCWFAF